MFKNVMRIDFTLDYGNWSENLVALFNSNKISEREVRQYIYSGEPPIHPDIIVISPAQFDSVFSKED